MTKSEGPLKPLASFIVVIVISGLLHRYKR